MKSIYCALLLVAIITIYSFDVPKSWHKAGSDPDKYEMGLDPKAGLNGSNAATIQSNESRIRGFGTLMQSMTADKYRGKKIKMTGYMRSEKVKHWAGFWVRVDGSKSEGSLAYDNMYDRPVKGNTEWAKYEIVLNVPERATNISFGAMLDGTGKIWFDNIQFEAIADPSGFKNNKRQPDPANLNFEE